MVFAVKKIAQILEDGTVQPVGANFSNDIMYYTAEVDFLSAGDNWAEAFQNAENMIQICI